MLAPELVRGLKGERGPTKRRRCAARASGATWRRSIDRRPRGRSPPSNALLLAVLVLPPLRDALDPDSNGVRDIGQLVAQVDHAGARAAAAVAARQRDRAPDPARAALHPARRRAAPPESGGRRRASSSTRRCASPRSSPTPRRPTPAWPGARSSPRARRRRATPSSRPRRRRCRAERGAATPVDADAGDRRAAIASAVAIGGRDGGHGGGAAAAPRPRPRSAPRRPARRLGRSRRRCDLGALAARGAQPRRRRSVPRSWAPAPSAAPGTRARD